MRDLTGCLPVSIPQYVETETFRVEVDSVELASAWVLKTISEHLKEPIFIPSYTVKYVGTRGLPYYCWELDGKYIVEITTPTSNLVQPI